MNKTMLATLTLAVSGWAPAVHVNGEVIKPLGRTGFFDYRLCGRLQAPQDNAVPATPATGATLGTTAADFCPCIKQQTGIGVQQKFDCNESLDHVF